MASHYGVVVVGSGYGGSVAASRLARAGQKVCLLERGREILPGEYPDSQLEAAFATQLDTTSGLRGRDDALFRFSVHEDISVLSGNGLGGTSLINANVALTPEPRVFDDPRWPSELTADAVLGEGMERALEMLRPTPYPDTWPRLAKLDALEESAEELGQSFHRPPINVTFVDGTNHVGVDQKACTLCGDCVTGCNHGAKNTLLMNYLPDAKRHGAEIFCEVSVTHVEREEHGAWTVHFRPTGLGRELFEAPRLFVHADVVILAAGSLGSTEIMLRSAEEGLSVSDRLGHSFTGNGDVLGLSYNGDQPVHGVGYGSDADHGRPPVGPCITGVIDARQQPELGHGMVIEEGVMPSALGPLLPEILAAASRASSADVADKSLIDLLTESGRELESMIRGPYHGAADHTQTFLLMTHDDSSGQMELDDDRLSIRWPGVGEQASFHRANQALERATRALGGTYLENPLWSRVADRDLITVHPLGGCPMGEDASSGVVDARGRVFAGQNGTGIHDGLYVVDGSIVPCAVGVNPLLTISALAERIVALLAGDRGWQIDYTLDSTPFEGGEPAMPGIRFTETMHGFISPALVSGLGTIRHEQSLAELERTGEPISFTLTIASDDIAALLSDPEREARAFGTLDAPSLHGEPLTVTRGTFELMSLDPEDAAARRMVYRLHLVSEEGDEYDFEGVKFVKDDPGLDTWSDTTRLYFEVHDSSDGKSVGGGVMRIGAGDLLRQLRTIEVTGTDDFVDRLRWQARFGGAFVGRLFDTYGGIATGLSVFDPDSPPRKRRELRAPPPVVYSVPTADDLHLRLTRYQGGARGPILVTAGIGVSSRVFSLDTVETNMTEALTAQGFDVWLLDWRSSIDLPSASQRWDLDMAAADLPAVVDTVRSVTGAAEVDTFVHCVGSIAFFLALLRGMSGVRSVVSSQVAIDTVPAPIGKWKAGLYIPGVLDALGIDSLTAYVDSDGGWQSRLFDLVLKAQPTSADERCNSPTCHRGTFMYGLLWEHDQLNDATHDTLHEWMGVANIDVIEHLALMGRKEHVVWANGDESDLEHLDRLAIPITLIHGSENQVFVPEATERTLHRLRAANPATPYARHLIPGYGHLDPVMGANAARDVYPLVIRHLEMVERMT